MSASIAQTLQTEILVDADACPVKDEIYTIAERRGAKVFVVSNAYMALPRAPFIERVIVPTGPDVADDWIAARAASGSVVVTADMPLADRCVKAGASVLSPAGKLWTVDNIGAALATRNLMTDLRSVGAVTSGPAPFSLKDRSQFKSALDLALARIARNARRL